MKKAFSGLMPISIGLSLSARAITASLLLYRWISTDSCGPGRAYPSALADKRSDADQHLRERLPHGLREVVFLLDDRLLLAEEVATRDDADNALTVHDRQMAVAAVLHHAKCIGGERRGHDCVGPPSHHVLQSRLGW